MPKSGRSSKLAGNIFPARSNVPLTHTSSSAAKEKPLLPVTRGSEIGDATRLSRCAGSAMYPVILPERVLDSPTDTDAWIPFGGRVALCIGATFPEFEMRVVLL